MCLFICPKGLSGDSPALALSAFVCVWPFVFACAAAGNKMDYDLYNENSRHFHSFPLKETSELKCKCFFTPLDQHLYDSPV